MLYIMMEVTCNAEQCSLFSFLHSGNAFEIFPVDLVSKVAERGWLSLARMNFTKLTAEQLDAIFRSKCIVYLRGKQIKRQLLINRA